jgi:BirA family biotin operon repressor/biotin-[acetyl-CoA-carboxylase] ligase
VKLSFSPAIERHQLLDSTQDRARELAEQGAPEGTVVVTDAQTGGRGRLGRSWASPAGGLWFSLILRPRVSPAQAPGLGLMTAVSLADAVSEVTGLAVGIKWPNDLMIAGKKFGGILAEMTAGSAGIAYVLIGAGINADFEAAALPAGLRLPATSLRQETGGPVDPAELLDACLAHLAADYASFDDSFPAILERWRRLSVVLGRRVTVAQSGRVSTGTAVEVDEAGALLLKDDAGEVHSFRVGDVSLTFD